MFNVSTLKTSMQMGNVFERILVVFAGSFGLLSVLLAAVILSLFLFFFSPPPFPGLCC